MKAFFLAFLLWVGSLLQSVGLLPVPAPVAAPVAETPQAASPAPPFPKSEPAIAEELSPVSEPEPIIASVSEVVKNVSTPAVKPEYAPNFAILLEAAIHERINIERVNNGLKALKYDTVLADVARDHSADMAKNNYFSHTDNDECDSACRLNKAEYEWQAVGENIFLMDSGFRHSVEDAAAVFVQGWMGSEGHRKNILQKLFTYEGLGVVVSGNKIYATELLTRPL